MLVGVRDKNGLARVFYVFNEERMCMQKNGTWNAPGDQLLIGDHAEPFCRNIPNGEKRAINLEKSTIVHDEPERDAVEELVEACKIVSDDKKTDTTDCMRALRSALARYESHKGGK